MSSPNFTITNERILSFYRNNPNIEFEAINLIIIELMEKLMYDTNTSIRAAINNEVLIAIRENNNNIKQSVQQVQAPICSFISACEDRITNSIITGREQNSNNQIITDLSEMIHQIKNMNKPTNTHLASILTKLYNSAEISTQNIGYTSGTILLKRIHKSNILIQNKESEENVSLDDVNAFMLLIEEQNCNGIFISQKSGIVNKKNFQIELHNNNVIVFIHNCEYSSEKIELAISIIDNLLLKIRQFKGKVDTDMSIPKEILDTINTEYQLFISQKTALIDIFKESQRKVLSQIDELRFPSLDKFLSTKYSTPIQKPGLKCDLCKGFYANNLKALAAHKRGCIRKSANSPQPLTITMENIPVNIMSC